jgi:phosphoglycolate phosphatase
MSELDWKSPRALIFDLDGTLIDSKNDLISSVNATLRQLGRRELPAETISSYIGHGVPLLVARALGDGCSDEERQRALEFFLEYYNLHKTDTTRPYPGVGETLERLRSAPMAVLTNKPVRISVRILDALGLSGYFRSIYGGNSFPAKKPDPAGALTILREFGASAHEALMVGDSDVDVQTARNAGMRVAIVNYGFGVHDRQANPADVYLDRFSQLTTLFGLPESQLDAGVSGKAV